jgi:hypothetical protein
MGRKIVVLGGSDDFGYGISTSENCPNVCVFEYFCVFSYLWANVCECCPSLVFVRACVYCGVFCLVLSGVAVFALLSVGNHYVGLCAELLAILFWRSELSGMLIVLSL